MDLRTIALAALTIAVAGCGRAPTIEEKIAALDAERSQVLADLVRQRSECEAQAVEFPGNPEIAQGCVQSLRTMSDLAMQTVATLDKRITELRAVR